MIDYLLYHLVTTITLKAKLWLDNCCVRELAREL